MARWVLIYLLGFLPQTFLLLYAALGLVGARAGSRRLAVPAATLGLVALMLRPTLSQGWYIPVSMAILVASLMLFRLASTLEAVAAAAIGFILIAAGDLFVMAPTFYLLGFSYDQVVESPRLYVVFGSLEGTFLAVAALLVRVKAVTVVSISRWEKVLAQRRAGK
ncbi:hypothetical protein [Limnochorda pilosa]|nr:hypothetical protein [Limnochorda pilosa]